MPKKDTEELEEALSGARDVRDYFDENADELAERTLAEELARLLAEKHLTKSLVAERSGLDRTYAYHIFDGKKPLPAPLCPRCLGQHRLARARKGAERDGGESAVGRTWGKIVAGIKKVAKASRVS